MRVFITAEQAISCMPDSEYIHVYINCDNTLVGADWKRQEVINVLCTADSIEIGGKLCRSMGHGLVVAPRGTKYYSDLYFVECDDDKLAAYDAATREGGKCG